MLAFDFWTVKNVSGRLLVGLRWWNDIKEDGKSEWVFESRSDKTALNKTDSRVFWYSLYITSAVWILMGLLAIFTLAIKWIPLVVLAALLNSANVVGYTKCEKDAKKKLQSSVAQGLMGSMFGGDGGSGWTKIVGMAVGK